MRIQKLEPCSNLPAVQRVYGFVSDSYVVAPKNQYIQNELKKSKIDHLYDFSVSTLSNSLKNLRRLEDQKIITTDERAILCNASHTLLDIRRNVYVHSVLLLTVFGSLNGDLADVYIPAINLLFEIYYRK